MRGGRTLQYPCIRILMSEQESHPEFFPDSKQLIYPVVREIGPTNIYHEPRVFSEQIIVMSGARTLCLFYVMDSCLPITYECNSRQRYTYDNER